MKKPARNFTDARGGGRIVGVLSNFTLSVAHYYTYLDTPTLRVVTPTRAKAPPLNLGEFQAAVAAGPAPLSRFLVDHFHANVLFPKMQISGATVSFSLPPLYAVVRGEFAYFYAEPFFLNSAPSQILGPALTSRVTPGYRQVGTDAVSGKALLRYKSDIDRSDVARWALGIDVNRYMRLLNPQQSFLISAQTFGTHILDFNSIPLTSVARSFGFAHFSVPVRDPHRKNQAFVNLDPYQLINTLSISTSYRSGVISPALIFLYDGRSRRRTGRRRYRSGSRRIGRTAVRSKPSSASSCRLKSESASASVQWARKARSSSRPRAHRLSRLPSAARPCAIARPIPRLAPLIMATLPVSPKSIFSSGVSSSLMAYS